MNKKRCVNCRHMDYTDDNWNLQDERPYCDLGRVEFNRKNGFCEDWESMDSYMVGACDICGKEYEIYEKPYFPGALLYNRIRIDRYMNDKTEIRTYKVCEACAMNVINHIKVLANGEGA